MGTLTPGALLIYERANGVIYARETGKNERVVIGYDSTYNPTNKFVKSEWLEILTASESNPALQEAVDRVKIIYNLSKQNGQ
jgi:hypothetical protein